METRAQLGIMPRVVIILLTIALLAIGAIGGFLVAGNLTNADDGGGGSALTYTTRSGVVHSQPTDGTDDPVRLTGDDEIVWVFAWSPDGTRFSSESWASPEGPATITVRDADGSDRIAVSEPFDVQMGAAPSYQAWSPDGSRILYWAPGLDVVATGGRCGDPGTFCGQRIWSVTSDGSEPAQVIGDPALDARSPLWTPDGASIIFTGSEGRGGLYGIYRMGADGANVERIGDLDGSEYAFDRHAISPDGTTVAVVSGHGLSDIHLLDLATGEEVLIAGEDALELEPYWSPDGSLIAFTKLARDMDGVEEAMLYDVASAEVIALGTSLSVTGWSPDGRSILGHRDGSVTVVDVTDPMAPVVTQVEGPTEAFAPSYQPLP